MGLRNCPICNHQASHQATACPGCGHPLAATAPTSALSASPATAATGPGAPAIVALIGGTLLAIGPFLPWATLGMLSASGMDKTGGEALIVVALGLVGAAAALAALVQKKRLGRGGGLIVSLFALLMMIYYTNLISDQLAGIDIGSPGLGAGIYLSFLGAAMLLLSALLPRPARADMPDRT